MDLKRDRGGSIGPRNGSSRLSVCVYGPRQMASAAPTARRNFHVFRKPRRIHGATVVITGASSGIGRATALAFARCGARIVVAARRTDLLEEVVRDCERIGAEAMAVTTDVTDADAILALAAAAEAAFGGIDIWINNAGTGVFGPYHEADIELHRRTVEANLFGAMHGAWAVLPIFKR